MRRGWVCSVFGMMLASSKSKEGTINAAQPPKQNNAAEPAKQKLITVSRSSRNNSSDMKKRSATFGSCCISHIATAAHIMDDEALPLLNSIATLVKKVSLGFTLNPKP